MVERSPIFTFFPVRNSRLAPEEQPHWRSFRINLVTGENFRMLSNQLLENVFTCIKLMFYALEFS
jgi:hypothetical protein